MYMSSRTGIQSNIFATSYDQLSSIPRTSKDSLVKHRRIKTEHMDRERILEEELWCLEQKNLQEELECEKKSHWKSMRLIKELIEDNHKYYQQSSNQYYQQSTGKYGKGIKDKLSQSQNSRSGFQ